MAAFLLLGKKADVNRAASDGSTPLMIAASKGHIGTVRLLLNNSAQVDRTTRNGCSGTNGLVPLMG